jgi:hypothetical protein
MASHGLRFDRDGALVDLGDRSKESGDVPISSSPVTSSLVRREVLSDSVMTTAFFQAEHLEKVGALDGRRTTHKDQQPKE